MKRLALLMTAALVLVVAALPALGAEDTTTCFIDAAGQIICQTTLPATTPSIARAGETRTCTTDPEDGSGLPECGTRADNECNPGGTMGGKCDNEWLWKAGWEIARFNDGRMTREEVNIEWRFLLPPPVELPPGVVSSGPSLAEGCYEGHSWEDLYYYGPINTPYNAANQDSSDGLCSDDEWSTTIIYATDSPAAETLCARVMGIDIDYVDVYNLSIQYPDIPYGFWECYDD
jgi:hypothetical protein